MLNFEHRSTFLWLVGLLTFPSVSAQDPAPFLARVDAVLAADLLRLDDGRRLRLQGISLPDPVVRPEGLVETLVLALEQSCLGRELWIVPERRKVAGDTADLLGMVRPGLDAPSINEEILRAGLAVFNARSEHVRELQALASAGVAARRARRGWFANSPRPEVQQLSYLHGAVLGLHYQEPERDYHRQIDELHAAGFSHLSLLLSAFLDDVTASRIDRHHLRTVGDARLSETIGYAKSKGFSVMLLPIILLLDEGEDEWRGTLRPQDEEEFWLEYDRFLSHYLDIAESGGVDLFCIGSELGSLEDRRETWLRLILNARARFGGLLTYSANWDHLDTGRFFHELDVVGLTGYFSLTDELDPSRHDLELGWQKVGRDLASVSERIGRPLILTEIGYSSQQGTNTNPWDYLIDQEHIDLDEQADCFAAFLAVVPGLDFLKGAYFYDYFELGGPEDHSYSPRGKPAMLEWQRWAGLRLAGMIRRLPGR